MKKLFIFSLIGFFLLSFSSCSSSQKKTVQPKTVDARKDLELDEETQEKFEVKEKSSLPKKVIAKDKDKETRVENIPTTSKKSKKSKSTDSDKSKSEYPENFPQKYLDYDKAFKKTWDAFDSSYLNIGEKIKMRVSYLGLGMGSMELVTKPNVIVGEKEAFSFFARLKTAAFYSYIYELDDSLTAHVEKNEFLPLKYELIQRESKKEIDDIQLFDQDKHMLYYRYRRWRKDKKKLTKRKDDIFIPKYSIDPFSLLYFVRGLPLKTGHNFSFPIVTRNKLWVVKLVVGQKEQIKTIKGKRSVYKVTAQIGEGGSFIKKGAIELWFDAAEGHMLWKLRVGTKIGSLYAKVEEIIL